MALTDDERDKLAAALAETPGALEALALAGTEAARWPLYPLLAEALADEAVARAGVPRPTGEEVGRIAYPLIAELPAVRSFAPVFAAHRARGGRVPREVARGLVVALVRALAAKIGTQLPSAPDPGPALAC